MDNNKEENIERMSWHLKDMITDDDELERSELRDAKDDLEEALQTLLSNNCTRIYFQHSPYDLYEKERIKMYEINVENGKIKISNDEDIWMDIEELENVRSVREIAKQVHEMIYEIQHEELEECEPEDYLDCEEINCDGGNNEEACSNLDVRCECSSVDDTAPCCGDLDDIPEVYDCLTDDMFPAEATEKDKHNKYVRRTPWTEIDSVNKSNKQIVDDYIKYFREKFPEKAKDKTDTEILAENDDIWEHGLYDDLLLNSLKNGNYVLDTYSDDGYVKGGLKGKNRHDVLANFDVVIDCTLVGYVCRPYIVFGISKQHSWMANAVDDDYTREELRKISDLSGPKNDEELHWWRTEGVYKYHEREIELYKEGHVHFEIQDLGTEYRQYIRKVDHKADKHKVTHDIW